MVKFYRTDDKLIHELDTMQGGTWIQMVNPSVAEGQMVADDLNVDIEDVLAALDEEESSRIEPVSYTHLDVYKRQGRRRPMSAWVRIR